VAKKKKKKKDAASFGMNRMPSPKPQKKILGRDGLLRTPEEHKKYLKKAKKKKKKK
jgi:hypothetical protein